MIHDTIAAIATAVSNSGIGIIRVSGERAIKIVSEISYLKGKSLTDVESHTINYGFIVRDDKSMIDEVMISVMKAPRSYTMEDVVEINCHGGAFVINNILMLLIEKGVRLAEPGEFTKRAFLNGRIDLTKAEAIMDIIQSKNEFSLQSSVNQLKGSIFNLIKDLRKEIIHEIAFIESALDDPEHITLEDYPEKLNIKLDDLCERLDKLLKNSDNGILIKEGIKTVILGKPNVGKSSFLNLITGKDKAIVTDIAGTTRDVIEETVVIDGIVFHIIDTAGIRDTEDTIEKIGVEKSKLYAQQADFIIYMVDSSMPLDENDMQILDIIKDKKSVILLNKIDLDVVVNIDNLKKYINDDCVMIEISVKQNEGIESLIDAVKNIFFHGEITFNDEVYITSMRHKEALKNALDSLHEVRNSLINEMPEDFYSIDLMNAYSELGKIIGEEIEEDLINEIFSNFCLGK